MAGGDGVGIVEGCGHGVIVVESIELGELWSGLEFVDGGSSIMTDIGLSVGVVGGDDDCGLVIEE